MIWLDKQSCKNIKQWYNNRHTRVLSHINLLIYFDNASKYGVVHMAQIIRFHTKDNLKKEMQRKMCKNEITKIRSDEELRNNIPACAKLILNAFKVDFSLGGVPIVKILNSLGIKTFQKKMVPRKLSAYISIDPEYFERYGTCKIACVNSSDNIGHKRFALAHELGHYIFDYDEDNELTYINTYIADDNIDDDEEKRANLFAANLLMPEDIFKSEAERIKGEVNGSKPDTITNLAMKFEVSPSAVIKRMQEVGLESKSLDN